MDAKREAFAEAQRVFLLEQTSLTNLRSRQHALITMGTKAEKLRPVVDQIVKQVEIVNTAKAAMDAIEQQIAAENEKASQVSEPQQPEA
ncbi:MAG: hypothetical protein LLF76_08160 [Planctomycetaceae bacterium]|nr:hypothetical protein [Planctomycetaceae bacterium]